MVKFYQHTSSFEHAWDNVTYAFWLRYPNPFASHVVGCDVIDRHVDPVTGVLRTTRLILKQGVLPRWGRGVCLSSLLSPGLHSDLALFAFVMNFSLCSPKLPQREHLPSSSDLHFFELHYPWYQLTYPQHLHFLSYSIERKRVAYQES